MTASLLMYARPELETAHTIFWREIRTALAARAIAAPDTLRQEWGEDDIWTRPDLVLSQTCGMPYRTRLHGTAQLVGTPDYGLEGCPAGYYRSVIVARADDARGDGAALAQGRLAYNSITSQSGFAAIWAHMLPFCAWFDACVPSGGHAASARMVLEGAADVAALDAQTWRLLQRFEGWTEGLRVVAQTTPTPGLPYVTAAGMDAGAVFAAVQDAIAALPVGTRTALDLQGIIRIPADDYLAVPNPPEGIAG